MKQELLDTSGSDANFAVTPFMCRPSWYTITLRMNHMSSLVVLSWDYVLAFSGLRKDQCSWHIHWKHRRENTSPSSGLFSTWAQVSYLPSHQFSGRLRYLSDWLSCASYPERDDGLGGLRASRRRYLHWFSGSHWPWSALGLDPLPTT